MLRKRRKERAEVEVEVVVVVEVELVEVLAEVEAGSQKVHRDDLIKNKSSC